MPFGLVFIGGAVLFLVYFSVKTINCQVIFQASRDDKTLETKRVKSFPMSVKPVRPAVAAKSVR